MEDIRLVLKPVIDTKEVDKSMADVAKNSATALQKTFTDLRATLSQSAKGIGDEFRLDDTLDKTLSQARKFYMEFSKISQTAVDTGLLPEGIDTKMYGLLSEVNRLAKAYAGAYTEARRFADANVRAIPIGEYAKFEQTLQQLNTDYMASVQAVTAYQDAIEATAEKERLIGQLKNGEKTLALYEKYTENVNKAREALEKLKQEGLGKYIDASERPLDATKYRNAVGGAEQKQYLADLQTAKQYLEDQKRVLNTIRNIDKDRIKEIQQQQAIIDRAYGGESASIEKMTADIAKEANEQERLTDKINATRAAMESIPQDDRFKMDFNTQQESDQFSNMVEQVRKLKEELVVATTRVNEVDSAARRTGTSMSQWRNVVWSISRVLGNVYTISLDFTRMAKSIANIYKNIWGYLKRIASIFKKLRDSIKGTAKEHAKSWKDMLRDVVRYAFGIRSLFALFRRLRRYIREAFEEMAKQIPEVNKVLSELKSSLGMLKGSLATAFEPILSAVAPALNFLIEKLSQVMTYIGMFFAALTGRGYVYKATKSMQDFAKATKEANKQLQGFDELNNLTTNKDNGAEDAPMAIFKKVPVLDWIKDLADKIKAIIMRILDPIKKAWARIGPYVEAAWRRAFYNVKKLLMDIGRDFLRAWDEMGQSISEHFLEIVGDIGNIIANIAEALDTAWNANENGYRIWKAILTIVDKIIVGIRNITTDMVIWTHDLDVTPAMTAFADWFESLEPIVEALMSVLFDFWDHALKPILTWAFDGENSGIARLFKILKDFNDKLDTTKIRANLDKVWQALGRFGQTVGEGLLIFLERMSDRIANWANSDKFERLCDSIVEFLDNIEPEDVADDLEQLLDIVLNLAGQVRDAIMFVVEHKDTILNILEFISEHLKGILFTLITFKTAIDLARLGANIFLMVTALEKVGGFSGAIAILTSKFQGLGAAISNIGFGSIISKFAGIFAFFEGVKLAITSFVDMWKNGWNVISSILEAFGLALAAIGAVLLGAPALVAAVVAGVIWAVSQLVIYIHDHWEEIKEVVKVGIIVIKDWFNQLFENAKQKLQNFKENMKVVWQFIQAFIKGILQSIGQMVQNKINEWIKKLNEVKSKFSNSKLVSIASGGSPILNQISTRSASPVTRSAQSLNIPKLAQGAVIPPNKEFLAMLGDQKSGTNIESPLSTMVEAFNQAGGNRSEQELTLLQEQNQLLRQLIEKEWSISASQMFSAMQRQAVVFTKQSGKPAFS